MKNSDIRHSIVSTDLVLFTYVENKLKVFLIEVQNEEYKNKQAFPGGLVNVDETTGQAIKRIVKSKIGLEPEKIFFELLGVYSEVDRDVRGRVISIAYVGFINSENILEGTYKGKLYNFDNLKGLAYDHDQMTRDAKTKFKELLTNTTIAQVLLGQEFTMGNMLDLFNFGLGKEIDKRNFIKKIKSLNIIKETGRKLSGMKNRPAKLFRYKDKNVKKIEIF